MRLDGRFEFKIQGRKSQTRTVGYSLNQGGTFCLRFVRLVVIFRGECFEDRYRWFPVNSRGRERRVASSRQQSCFPPVQIRTATHQRKRQRGNLRRTISAFISLLFAYSKRFYYERLALNFEVFNVWGKKKDVDRLLSPKTHPTTFSVQSSLSKRRRRTPNL